MIDENPADKSFRKLTKEESDHLYAEASGISLVLTEARQIQKWPDYKFTTKDGREFGLFICGRSILRRIYATDALINWKDKNGIKEIEDLAGMIQETGSDGPPRIFHKTVDLANAWEQLHVSHGIPITKAEDEEFLDQILDGQPPLGPNDGHHTEETIH